MGGKREKIHGERRWIIIHPLATLRRNDSQIQLKISSFLLQVSSPFKFCLYPSLRLTATAPENKWLEDDPFPFRVPSFLSGVKPFPSRIF